MKEKIAIGIILAIGLFVAAVMNGSFDEQRPATKSQTPSSNKAVPPNNMDFKL